jgi:hypothetical protein
MVASWPMPKMRSMANETDLTDGGSISVARILLLVQGAIATVTVVEAAVFGTAFGAPLSAALLFTGVGAGITLWLAAAVVRRSRRARKVALIFQGFWLAFAAIDVLLAGFLVQRSLELVPMLSRVVLPVAIIALLEQRSVRAWFGVTSRRERRRATPRMAS